jgi:hypothetical protein
VTAPAMPIASSIAAAIAAPAARLKLILDRQRGANPTLLSDTTPALRG